MKNQDFSPAARRQLLEQLESWQRAGVTQLGRVRSPDRGTAKPRSAGAVPETDPPGKSSEPMMTPRSSGSPSDRLATPTVVNEDSPSGTGLSLSQRLQVLDQVRGRVASCTRCPELVANRTQTVFGVGNPQARLCFLGEAPGADEDRQGEPFVGRAGQLLNKIIESCRLTRQEVYILNICKCRPPQNRAPEPAEAANCREYLDAQLEAIRPEFLCCLGAVAAQNLLDTTVSIGKLRGQLHDHRGIRVLCTYHPAYLLRNPAMKRECWEDMKLLMREMGQPVE